MSSKCSFSTQQIAAGPRVLVSIPAPKRVTDVRNPLQSLCVVQSRPLFCRQGLNRCAAASGQDVEMEWEELPLPEGDLGLPLVGQTFEWLSAYKEFYISRFEKHGKVFKTRLLGQNMVVIADNATIRRLLAGEHKLVESYWPQSMQALLGEKSILRAPAKSHISARRLLNQAFTPAALVAYAPSLTSTVETTLDEWAAQGTFKGWNGCRGLAFDVAAVVLLGRRIEGGRLVEMRESFETFLAGMFSIPVNLPFTKYGKAMKARNDLLKIIEELIKDARNANQDNVAGTRRNALQLLLSARDEDGAQLTDEELKDQILTQLFAGHETTGSVMMHTLLLLEANPGWLERMREEQRQVVAKYGPALTAAVLDDMPCVDATIREALRVRHPIGGGVWRRALEPLVVDGYRIPQGWTLELALKKSWENAADFGPDGDMFDPSRFLPQPGSSSREESKSFIPWGAGPRTCLGMSLAIAEMRTVFALLARSYQWSQADPDEAWIADWMPSNGLPFNFSRLDSAPGTAIGK